MEECKIINLYNLNETIAAPLFEGLTYPWEDVYKRQVASGLVLFVCLRKILAFDKKTLLQ